MTDAGSASAASTAGGTTVSTDPQRCRVVTWNLERKNSTSPRGADALAFLFSFAPDVAVMTEARSTMDPGDGYLLCAPLTPKGNSFADDERKVVAWSGRPWRAVDTIELLAIDRSRIVTGTTETPLGTVTVLAVCIPWHMADVSSGVGPKRAPWELHLAYLAELGPILARCGTPVIVAGDFNQRIPRVKGGNRAAADALAACFSDLTIVTAGRLVGCDRPGIDHIACSPDLVAARAWGWRHDQTGRRLSDHDGAGADLELDVSAEPVD